jgi:hypothetical protein
MTTTLYDTDFYAWTQEQASLLRAEEVEKLDLSNLLEEIEAMGQRERRELTSRLTVLIMHLLKWQYQPEHRSKSWASTLRHQRYELALLLDDSPSLRRELPERIALVYPRACANAIGETGLLALPTVCPYTSEQILDEDFLPQS